jgi:NAD(P)-dependent dehydrogenase (short-subunit alcohol dehydrogenase family)
VVEEIRAAGGQALADGYDVATAAGVRALAAAALERWRRLDALVSLAGPVGALMACSLTGATTTTSTGVSSGREALPQ